jgi:4-amino-4-deoxy-L-arabinose transferase-like glycosyltransferase
MIERWSAGGRPYALLLLLCLALYLPGIAALPPIDRDEARFAQATRQMLESGDFLRIRFQDEARNKKPAGIYWLQAVSVSALSSAASPAIWPYRLPSLLGAAVAVLLTFALGSRLVGRAAALIGAALLASSVALVAEAHLAKADAVLLATVVAAQGALGAIYHAGRRGGALAPWPWALLFWTAQGLAVLIKGPVAPVMSLLTAVTLSIADRDASWLRGLRPLRGVLLLLAIAGPWLVAITVVTNGAFLGESVGHDLLGKIVGAQESHGAPPGAYLLLLAATFWPGSLLLAPALAWGWRARAETTERFLIAWALPFWLLLEIVPTKLPHYILPAYPALTLLVGRALIVLASGGVPRPRWFDAIVIALWTLVSFALAALLLWLSQPIDGGGLIGPGWLLLVAAVALLSGGLAVSAWRGLRPRLALGVVALALLVLSPGLQFVAPDIDELWLSRDAAAAVARYRPPPAAPVVAVGYGEPSLVFLLGTATRFLTPDQAAQYITAARGATALVSDRDDEAFRQALQARGWAPRAVDRIAGLDYSRGRRLTLTLYTAAPG